MDSIPRSQAPATAAGFLIALLAFNVGASAQLIRPGQLWPDDRGKHIQAHGGGILHWDGAYYWFGEDRSRDNDPNFR
ncbi:MAG: hypothetical protein ACLQVY_25320 [Limisphaerales bacterium]